MRLLGTSPSGMTGQWPSILNALTRPLIKGSRCRRRLVTRSINVQLVS